MASKEVLKIAGLRLTIDGAAQFNKSLKDINANMKLSSAELAKVTAEHGKNSASAQVLAARQTDLKNKLDLQRQTTQRLNDVLRETEQKFGKNSAEATTLRAKVLESEAAEIRLQKALDKVSAEIDRQNSAWHTFGQRVENAGNAMKTAGDKMQKVGDKFKGIGNKLSVGLTAPLLLAAKAAVTMGNDFEAQMSRVQAIAGATGDDMAGLEQLALDLGASTKFSASEVAEGMENLASAGFTVTEITKSMQGMLDLAASSGADLATASEIAASSLRGFGLDASNAGRVADVFAKAAAETNAQTEDLGEAMKYIAPVAGAMGLSIEETAAAVGILSDAGIKGEQAGTSLRGMLSRMTKQSKKAKDVMKQLGLEFYDANGKMKPMADLVAELTDKTSGLTDEQRNNAIVTLFGQEALSGVLALMKRGSGSLKELTKQFENSDGAAEDMAKTMMDNTKGSIEEMNGAIETAAITAQKALAPSIRDAAKWVQGLADKFSKLDPETQKTILKFAGITAAAGPVIRTIGSVTSAVGSLAKGVGNVVSTFGNWISSGSTLMGVLGTGGLVGVAGLALGAFALLVGTTSQARQEVDALIESTKESQKAYEDQIAGIETNTIVAKNLTDQLFELNDKEKLTNAEKARMKDLVKQLNDLVPELALEIDNETGKITAQKDEIRKLIDEKMREIKLNAYADRITKLLQERVEIQDQLKQRQKDYAEAVKDTYKIYGDGFLGDEQRNLLQTQYLGIMRDLGEEMSENIQKSKETEMAYNDLALTTGKSSTEIKNSASSGIGYLPKIFDQKIKESKGVVKNELNKTGEVSGAAKNFGFIAGSTISSALKNPIVALAGKGKSSLWQAAISAIQGFINGVWGMRPAVSSTGQSAASWFLGAFKGKKGLDEESPSKAMDEAAYYAVEGYVRRIRASERKIMHAAHSMASATLAGASEASISGAGTGSTAGDSGAVAGGIDYDRLAAAMVTAMGGVSIQVDRRTFGRVVSEVK